MKSLRCFTAGAFALGLLLALGGPVAAQGKSSDLLTKEQVKELTTNAKTPTDHLKLSKHYTALAAQYESQAADHAAMADVERKGPNAAETKRPGTPGTALHCDRLAENLRAAAKEARAVATGHEAMAKAAQ